MCNRKGGTLLVMKINAMKTGRSASPVEITLEGYAGRLPGPFPRATGNGSYEMVRLVESRCCDYVLNS